MMADIGPNIIAIVVIVIFILLIIAAFIWSSLNPPPEIVTDDTPLPDFNAIFTSSLSTEWEEIETSSDDCLKYTFVYPEQPTLNTSVLNGMIGEPFPTKPKIPTCPFSDEIGAQKFTRRCTFSECTDDDGNTYAEDDTQVLYKQCVLNQDCPQTLALISIGFDPDINNVCITQTSPLSLIPCNPADPTQLFAIERLNTQFAKITNKDGLCIVKGNSVSGQGVVVIGTELVMGPCPINAFTWDLLNSKRYPSFIDPTVLSFVPQQIVFWDKSTDQTVQAIEIVTSDPPLMSMSNSLSIDRIILLDKLEISSSLNLFERYNTQILDYSFYDYVITQPTQPIPGVTVFPFFSNLPEISL
uniref:Membrane protein n=1 Tax=Pithovirus LCPAC401 TaxID=2506595 RepID=A0A481ZBT6_9VIRU|nr:MAG: membrane protein [Pithovirus LCPAC401]